MVQGSYELGTVRGVPVRVHWTLLVALASVLAWVWRVHGVGAGAWAMVVAAGLFASVLAHELGHVAVAGLFGVRTREVTLYPVGGAAMMELRRVTPLVDAAVSAAGPAVSLVLGIGAELLGSLWQDRSLMMLGQLNVALGLFNLLPLFPLDGGRILRAALVPPLGLPRAHAVALAIGYAGVGLAIAACVAWRRYDLVVLGLVMFGLQERERQRHAVLARAGAER